MSCDRVERQGREDGQERYEKRSCFLREVSGSSHCYPFIDVPIGLAYGWGGFDWGDCRLFPRQLIELSGQATRMAPTTCRGHSVVLPQRDEDLDYENQGFHPNHYEFKHSGFIHSAPSP